MSIKVRAVYDGTKFIPEEVLDIAVGTEVELTVDVVDDNDLSRDYSFVDTALSLDIEGPTDWSTRVDEILYKYPRDADE